MKVSPLSSLVRAALVFFLAFIPGGQVFARTALADTIGNPQAVTLDLSIGRLNAAQPLRLSGLSSSSGVEIPTSLGWTLSEDPVFTVKAKYSEALDAQNSSLTFSINGTPLASLRVADLQADGTTVKLPRVRFDASHNTLGVTGRLYLRTDQQTNCADWNDSSRWLEIDPASFLRLALARQQVSLDLKDFPAPYQGIEFNSDGYGQIPTTFILPDGVSETSLNSLAAAAFAFGRAMPDRTDWNLKVLTRTQAADQGNRSDNLVFLGESQQGLLDVPQSDQDMLMLQTSPLDPQRAALVIHDANPGDGSRPELALGDQEHMAELGVTIGLLGTKPVQTPLAAQVPDRLTFMELGYNPRTVRGIGLHNLIYQLYIPYKSHLESAHLNLVLAHSQEAAAGTSLANVYLNGSSAANILLTDFTASQDTIEISLPVKDFRPGNNYLRFTFDLRSPANTCSSEIDALWATVMNTSELSLESLPSAPPPELSDFPQPFDDLPGSVLVIPDQVDAGTLNRVARLAILIGQSARPEALPPAIYTATAYNPSAHGRQQVIFIGAAQQNAAIGRINDLLPQPFSPNGTGLAAGYGLPAEQPASVGLVEVGRSPQDNDSRVLAITGTDQAGFLRAFDQLLDPTTQGSSVRGGRTSTLVAGTSTMLSGSEKAFRFSGNVVSVLPGSQANERVARAYNIYDAGNLPLIGPLLQSINSPGLGHSLATIFISLGGLLAFVICIQWLERRNSLRLPKRHVLQEEEESDETNRNDQA